MTRTGFLKKYALRIAVTLAMLGLIVYTVAHAKQGMATLINGRGEAAMARGVVIEHDCRLNARAFAEVAAEVYAQYGDPFWMLLAHRNNLYETYGPLGADLILSGHGHGGLIRLPFTDGLIGADRDLFPTWTSGFYTDFDSALFVSPGMGNVGRTFRFNNPPQLSLITLERDA